MKNLAVGLLAIGSWCVWAAGPQVTSVNVRGRHVYRPMTVTYTLSETPAIVTADILTNGVSIGAQNFRNLSGDVNVQVTDGGTHTFTWTPPDKWWGAGRATASDRIQVKVTAWPTNSPPDYMVLTVDKNLPKEPVAYYETAAALPGGIESDLYRTSKLVMKRIHARGKMFRMGSTGYDEAGGNSHYAYGNQYCSSSGKMKYEAPIYVTFTHDYYLGVFETTQYQVANLYNFWYVTYPSYAFTNATYRATRPVDRMQYSQVLSSSYWPNEDLEVANTSNEGMVMWCFRNWTGFDWRLTLPTSAQWEFACRAGSLGSWMGGYNATEWLLNSATKTRDEGRYGIVEREAHSHGRFAGNGGYVSVPEELDVKFWNYHFAFDTETGTARVGSYEPNDWGLYDMLGNVSEMVLDYATPDTAVSRVTWSPNYCQVDCAGPGQAYACNNRTTRGGSCLQNWVDCRPAGNYWQQMWLYYDGTGNKESLECTGFRLCYLLK